MDRQGGRKTASSSRHRNLSKKNPLWVVDKADEALEPQRKDTMLEGLCCKGCDSGHSVSYDKQIAFGSTVYHFNLYAYLFHLSRIGRVSVAIRRYLLLHTTAYAGCLRLACSLPATARTSIVVFRSLVTP